MSNIQKHLDSLNMKKDAKLDWQVEQEKAYYKELRASRKAAEAAAAAKPK